MNHLNLKRALLALTTLWLTGCSLLDTRTSVPQNLSPEDRIRYLQQQSYWKLTGRIGITTPQESHSASFSWIKDNDTIELRIYGSFGVTYAHLISRPGQASIELSNDKVYHDTDAERLLWQTTGWHIPVNPLQYWILGVPAQAPSFELDDNGYLTQLTYGYWRVDYRAYRQFNGLIMPKKLRVTHPEITLKFAIHDWTFKPES